jgi:hypothetical protein
MWCRYGDEDRDRQGQRLEGKEGRRVGRASRHAPSLPLPSYLTDSSIGHRACREEMCRGEEEGGRGGRREECL